MVQSGLENGKNKITEDCDRCATAICATLASRIDDLLTIRLGH